MRLAKALWWSLVAVVSVVLGALAFSPPPALGSEPLRQGTPIPRSLPYDEPQPATTSGDEADRWTFEAEAGQAVVVTVETGRGQVPSLELMDSVGALVMTSTDDADDEHSVLRVMLRRSETYTLVVSVRDPSGAIVPDSAYTITLARGADEGAASPVPTLAGDPIPFDRFPTFDGESTVVMRPHSVDYNISQFTIEAWINVPEDRFGGILTKGVNGVAYSLLTTEGNLLLFFVNCYPNCVQLWNSTQMLIPGSWNHVALTYDGAALQFYINGQPDPDPIMVGISLQHNTEPVTIGADLLVNIEFFKGQMGEVRLWNYARSAQEILAAKDVTLTGTETGLVLYEPFAGLEPVETATSSP